MRTFENLPNGSWNPTRTVQRFLDSCNGCYMYEHAIECKYLDKSIGEVCPCQICLVKVMCETTCRDFENMFS